MKTKYTNHFVNPTPDEMGNEVYPFAFDMDSVLNEMGDMFMADWLANHFKVDSVVGYTGSPRYRTFQFNHPDVSNNQMFRAVREFILEMGPRLVPSPWMLQTMRYVTKVTRKPILIVTARHPDTVSITQDWLLNKMPGVPFRVYSVNGVPKLPFLHHHRVEYFVDDRYKTNMSIYMDSDTVAPILYRRPWNQGRMFYDWIQINDLRDMIPIVNLRYGRAPLAWPAGMPWPNRGER